MKRAYQIELAIFRDSALQLLGLGLLTAILISFGVQTSLAAPAVLSCMFFMIGSMGAAVYDEQSNWGRFRLTLPLSRRDVVVGRYGAIVTLGLEGTVVGLAVALGLGWLSSIAQFPGNLSDTLAIKGELLPALFIVTAFCILIGSAVAAVVTPIYFALGQTKATQLLPTIIVMLFVLPVVFFGNSGLLSNGILEIDVAALLDFISTPVGVTISCAALIALAVVVLGVSVAISLKLYERREL